MARTVPYVTWDDGDDAPTGRSTGTVDRPIPFVPVLLIAIGAAALVHQLIGRGGSVFWLTIGLYFMARARRGGGHYPLLVVGAVMTGSGIGHLAGDIVHTGASESLGSFGTAGGFFWLYNTDRGRSSWAIIPAAILGLIGVGELGFHLTDLMEDGGTGWLLPAGVVVAGILLLGAHRLPGAIRLAGLVFVGAAALSLVTNDSRSSDRRVRTVTTGRALTSSAALSDINGRTVWLTTGSGDVTVETGEVGVAARPERKGE